MRINFFPRQRAAKRSPHSYTAEGGQSQRALPGRRCQRESRAPKSWACGWHSGTAGPRPEPLSISLSFYVLKEWNPGRWGQVVCLFLFLIHGHSDTGAGWET